MIKPITYGVELSRIVKLCPKMFLKSIQIIIVAWPVSNIILKFIN